MFSSRVAAQVGRKSSHLCLQTRNVQSFARAGRGGRSSVAGITATVFGATGFLGRYLVNRLGQKGTQLVIPHRAGDMHWRHLRPMGDIGQIVFMESDFRDYETVKEAVKHSDVVYNLIGRDYQTKNFSFHSVHAESAANIARACRETGVQALIQMSSIGAEADSPSAYFRSKALAEEAARAEFDKATIVRSARAFGQEDHFFNRWGAQMKLGLGLPIASMSAVRHPVYGIDVGHALANMVNDDRVLGNTYEFIGPRQYTTKELVDYMQEITRHKFHIYEAHPLFLKALGYLSEKSPWEPYFTVDEAVRDSLSETPTGLPGLADLGVTPTQLHQVAISFLRRYRDFLYYEEHVTANEYRV